MPVGLHVLSVDDAFYRMSLGHVGGILNIRSEKVRLENKSDHKSETAAAVLDTIIYQVKKQDRSLVFTLRLRLPLVRSTTAQRAKSSYPTSTCTKENK